MKVNYDPVADSIYIRLADKKSTKTVEVGGDLNADYAGKNLIGIETLDASEKLEKDDLGKVILSFPSYKPSKTYLPG